MPTSFLDVGLSINKREGVYDGRRKNSYEFPFGFIHARL